MSNTRFEHAGLEHSIPSDLAVIDINGDGYHDAAFVGDTGGNLWRVDFPSFLSDSGGGSQRQSEWKLTKVATMANAGTAWEDQRFFSAPEVMRSRDTQGDYLAIALGSGNREDQLDLLGAEPPQNWFYVVKDGRLHAAHVR